MNSTARLTRFILLDRWSMRLLIVVLALVASISGLAVPFYQKSFMEQQSLFHFFICTGLALVSFLCFQLTGFFGQRESLFSQRKISSTLYQHILALKPLTISHRTTGEMVSLYTSDIPSATMWLEQTLPYALTTAFPLILTPIFLNHVYHIPYLFSLGITLVLIAINIAMAYRQAVFFYQFKILAGERMGLVNEWIQNIKSLKSLSWIPGFENKIIKKRREETRNRVAMVTNGQIMNSISSTVTFWLNLLTLFFLLMFNASALTKFEILTLLWVMGIFLSRPLRQLPWFFTMMFDAWTSVRRLAEFLSLQNTESIVKRKTELSPSEALHVENLNLAVGGQMLLQNIHLKIYKKEVVALIGPVGSGKSLLLKSLMGETPFVADHVAMLGHSYLPQESFIMSATIRDNIVFDYDSDKSEGRAENSLKLAQFDIQQDRIQDGLDTLIGERGLNLSGGQKQRLNLSRLFYNPQPVMLLDDPFSAVDVGTEKDLITSVMTLRKSGHTFIVTTQRYSFLNHVDRILFLNEGKIEFNGSYQDFLKIEKYQDFLSGEENHATI